LAPGPFGCMIPAGLVPTCCGWGRPSGADRRARQPGDQLSRGRRFIGLNLKELSLLLGCGASVGSGDLPPPPKCLMARPERRHELRQPSAEGSLGEWLYIVVTLMQPLASNELSDSTDEF
jgi:hypothetical protein